MDEYNNFYETNSLVLASTIVCLGISLDSVIKNPDGKAIFVFPKSDNLDQIIESFWQKILRVEPNAFFESQRFLKSRIYGG